MWQCGGCQLVNEAALRATKNQSWCLTRDPIRLSIWSRGPATGFYCDAQAEIRPSVSFRFNIKMPFPSTFFLNNWYYFYKNEVFKERQCSYLAFIVINFILASFTGFSIYN